MFFSPLELHTWLLSPNLMLLFIHGLKKRLLLLIYFRAKILFLTISSKESNPNFMQNLIKNKLSFAIFNNGEIQTSDAYNLDNFRLFNLL